MANNSADTSAPPQRRCVIVCQYRTCSRSKSSDVLEAFKEHSPPTVFVSGSGCLGQCGSGPTVQVMPDGIWYCRVKPEDVPQIVEQHLYLNKPVKRLLHPRFHPDQDDFDQI